jgi:hypothetical protein
LHRVCPFKESCHRIHPRPPSNWLSKERFLQNSRVPATTPSVAQEHPGTTHARSSADLDSFIVKLPHSPVLHLANRTHQENSLTQVSLPRWVLCPTNVYQLATQSKVNTPKAEHNEVPKVSALNDRSNERSSLDRPLMRKTSSELTELSYSRQTHELEPVLCDDERYSGLIWDPQSNFWGYQIEANAWSDNDQSFNSNSSNYSSVGH